MKAILILAVVALIVLIAVYRQRRMRPKCPVCRARMSRADGGWQCRPCWRRHDRARGTGRGSAWTPGTWS